jgi:hypothetical protein
MRGEPQFLYHGHTSRGRAKPLQVTYTSLLNTLSLLMTERAPAHLEELRVHGAAKAGRMVKGGEGKRDGSLGPGWVARRGRTTNEGTTDGRIVCSVQVRTGGR